VDYAIVRSLLIALALGFAIGMQRSLSYLRKEEASFAGSRTFALIALAGYLSGWLGSEVPGFVLVASGGMALLIALSYALKVLRQERWGMTTQMAALLTWLLGLMIWYRLEHYAIFIRVLMIILLEIKPRLQSLERRVSPTDIQAVILLLAMSFVILPVLPDRMIGPGELFNPYKTWLMAVIISAISFVGYAAIKILGHKKGLFLTGALGGLVSSTAVSVSMSRLAVTQKRFAVHFAAAIAIACTFMFLRVLILVFVVNPEMAADLLVPFSAASAGGLAYTWYLYRTARSGSVSVGDTFARNPLQLSEAIKFGILFGIVYGAVAFVQTRYGDIGVYVVSMLSGITDVDAVTLTLAQLAEEGSLKTVAAMNGIIIASVVNSLVKLGIVCWVAGWRLGWQLARYFLVTLAMLGAGMWIYVK